MASRLSSWNDKPTESIILCDCCDYRYAQSVYKNKGRLCEHCEQHTLRKGKFMGSLEQPTGPDKGKRPGKGCFCCEVSYSRTRQMMTLTFECRDSILTCIPCIRHHDPDELRCSKHRASQLSDSSITKIAEALSDKQEKRKAGSSRRGMMAD